MKRLILTTMLFNLFAFASLAQTTEFTFQGRLLDGGLPPTGSYDIEFTLWDSLVDGTQLGPTETKAGVSVSGGIFTVRLDFGAQFTGPARFIEISVKPSGPGAFTPLAPRQPITSTPYAVKSLDADTAATANDASNLGGVPAADFVVTTDPRMTDDRNPTAGSANYIQNQNAGPQSSSNFNISGNGTAGGTLSGNIVSAATQFNVGTNRILSSPSSNLFAGIGAGQNNTTGSFNNFFGFSAGLSTTTGSDNGFFGTNAGANNTTGDRNTFFGANTGQTNSTGSDNAFFGTFSGITNSTGFENSFFGSGAGFFNTTGNNNSFFGRSAGRANTTGGFNSFFGTNAGRENTTGANNAFFGGFAGASNTTGNSNSFFGLDAGFNNTAGIDNSFFGREAGRNNTTANRNSFFGRSAGLANTTGSDNSFFGRSAGQDNTTGTGNSFFGLEAGRANTTGGSNSYFGSFAGANSSGDSNSFVGYFAGVGNSTGSGNSFIGSLAGFSNTTGTNNTIIGNLANVGAGNLSNATAIGNGAVVNASNKVRIGNASVTVIEGQVAYTFTSDKNVKENFLPVNGRDVLRKIRGFNMTSWNYIGQDATRFRHYGPMAQDFYNAFGRDAIGTFGSPTTINSGDMAGITLAAIKELSIENETLKTEIGSQQKQIETLQRQVDALKKLICKSDPQTDICKEEK